MTARKSTLQLALNLLTLLALLAPLASPWALSQPESVSAAPWLEEQGALPLAAPFDAWTDLFRAWVTFPNTTSRARLDTLGVVVLEETETQALILADGEQLETLARLRFQPQASEDLGMLAEHHAQATPWLAESLQPLLAQGRSARALSTDTGSNAGRVLNTRDAQALQQAQTDLRLTLQSLSIEQQAGIMNMTTIDSDGDGLTDTEETWWCTNPLNPDTKGDGVSDGAAVAALMAWMRNELPGPPASGTPFLGWPMAPGDGQFNPNCVDQDHDSVPDLAERWMLGLNSSRESTDRDKFDDGQELFGITKWGWGALPSPEDASVIFAEMPAFVRAPGNHPLVAAYPVPEIDVVVSSLRVETVTTVTTDHTIGVGTERSYSTAKTEGTSSSTTETETWNNWMEVSTYQYENRQKDSFLTAGLDPISLALSVGGLVMSTPGAVKDIRELTKGEPTLKDFLGFAIRPGEDNCLILEEDVEPNLDAVQSSIRPNTLYPFTPVGIGGMTPSGVLQSGNTDVLYKTWEFDSFRKDALLGDTLSIGSSGTLLRNGKDPLIRESKLCFGQSHAIQVHVPPFTNPLATFPRISEVTSQGNSRGGEFSTTHAQYEEHTITNGEAFSSSESWSTATAVNSSHAADLWFTYKVRNTGTDYAREISNLAFNVYLGADPNPIYTYFVAPDLGGDGKFHNFMPGEEHTYSARTNTHAIPLTLEMLRAIEADPSCEILRDRGEVPPYNQGGRCPGAKVRIVVEDFAYRTDEVFYQDALNAGVLIALEDGMDDGDEAIDTYVIPTWGEETVMDVLARYFPHTLDAYGNLIAIWTPEYRADTPAWCNEPRVIGSGARRTVWCKKALSTADWWNIYTNGMGDGSEGFQDTLASPGSVALFRFNKDSDLDGYSDRSELRLGTNPNDPASYPRPELLAGVHSIRVGNYVTATLSLLNTGLYDAYGVEAIMISPNDTISITNNTVGGSGRVRAQREVVVGSRILLQTPLPTPWMQSGHAQPAIGGDYTGQQDRTYTLTVQCGNPAGCDVSAGAWTLSWNDGAGANGTLNFGAGYASPTLLNVGTQGLKLGLLTGKVFNGETFTIETRTPRDTFQYVINIEPFTLPVVVVSYNDPQGNHRFIIPPTAMALSSPNADLIPFAGQMLQDPGVEIVTTEVFTPGLNTTNLVVNNPTGVTLTNAHLFLDFVNISGTVTSEVPVTVTLPAGPSVVPVTWDTETFSPTFQMDEDYIVLAFLTDWQGNILDTAGRPLSSFQADPRPNLAMSTDTIWDFGEAVQGTVLKHAFDLANTGYLDLLTYVNAPAGVTLSQQGSRSIGPADVTTYEIALDTSSLSVGSYSQIITIRSSDPESPVQTVHVAGNIAAGIPDTPVGALQRPLDWPIALASGTQGQWIEFTHTLGPNTQTLHPAKVYDQSYATLWGAGKYTTIFGLGSVSQTWFGDGSSGDLVVNAGQTVYADNTRSALAVSASGGQNQINLTSASGFAAGQEVLIIQMRGSNVGNYEYRRVTSVSNNTLTLATNLSNTYTVGGNSRAQVIRVVQYRNLTVQSGGVLTARAWDGSTGGVLAVKISGVAQIAGLVSVSGLGYRGGVAGSYSAPVSAQGWQGESQIQDGVQSRNANYGAGGGGQGDDGSRNVGAGGGGGGYGSAGTSGQAAGSPVSYPGIGGSTYGSANLATTAFLGSGGGGGGADDNNSGPGGNGGNGGGLMLLSALNLNLTGEILADGNNGLSGSVAHRTGGGGGGAGGSILLRGYALNLGTARVRTMGGIGGLGTDKYGTTPAGGNGGSGGSGRIQVEYCQSLSGTTNPVANIQQFTCHIAEQVETSPHTNGRLNLPESFSNGRTYQVQYGRRYIFGATGEQISSLRVSVGAFTDVRLDALISEVGTGTRTFRLDIGNDGTWDWEWTGSVTSAVTLNSPNLSAAFSRYWVTHGAPTSGTLDVPVKVYLSQAGQVLLTNLRVTPTGSKVRYARLPAQTYSSMALNLSVGTSGSGPLAVAADVGDNGSVDWTYTAASATYPLALTTGNLATAFNAYLAGHTGEVAVPVRFYVTPFVALSLKNFSATLTAKPDLSLTATDIVFSAANPTESDTVPITVTLHNNGALAATGHTVAFYATVPEWGEWYIGSAFVPGIPAGGAAQASIVWDTLGFTGATPVRVLVDPYNRLAETNEANNQATASLTILTRPDLQPAFAQFSNPEPVAGETVSVSLQVANHGQTAAGDFAVGFYDGNPDDGGTLLETVNLTAPGGSNTAAMFTWTPAQPGPHRLFVQVDKARAINESNRGNNLAWQDIYVGFAGPLLLDSGGASDPAYSANLGYGVLDEGPADVPGACGALPHERYRLDPAGRVVYRFDHLLPGHFYHLDVTLYECDGASRQQTIRVNGHQVAGPLDLGDGQVRRLSLLLDPALYSGHTIRVEIEAEGIDGAVVNEVNLYDVDYRYADAGGPRDPQYPGGALANLGRPYGWLNGVSNTAWGTLPSRSVRVNQTGNLLEYRFDGLQPEKRYNVHLSFWQPSGAARIQRIQLDGLDTGITVNTGDYQLHRETIAVPPTAYAADGSVVVGVLRINAATGAMVNEITLEEETLPRASWCSVQQTPYFTDVYGDVAILGQGAPAGTVIEARNPRGDTVGCFVVGATGQYGFMRIYGEDTTAIPAIPGMRAGELAAFRVNGAPAAATPQLYWQADYATHRVDLNAGSITGQSILLQAGWNLMSFRLEPPVPTVRQVLDAIDGRYDRVLGETGAYAPSVPDVFNTLKELHPGLGYYVRISGSTSASALIEGLPVPVTTPIPLHAGWNWIGYLPEVTLPITVALQSIEGYYQRVLSLDKTYDPALPSYSTLHSMEPGKGYLIYANQAVTLTYPAGSTLLNVMPERVVASGCGNLNPTPQFTLLYGDLLLGDRPAPAGSRVEVLTPRGEVAGCFVLEKPGIIGFMQVYGEDATLAPTIAGFRDGEPLAFRINGMPVDAEALVWQDDWTPYAITLRAEHVQVYLPLVLRGH